MMQNLVTEFAEEHGLTPRETDIVRLLADQIVWLKDIAQTLKVSPHTVNNHFKSIFEKTNTNSRTELISILLKLAISKSPGNPYLIRAPHVVVVDDEADICKLLEENLSARQMRVECFTNSKEFLERLPYLKADVIISDIRMPGLNGIELLKELKKSHRLVPGLIFISGFAGDYDECDLMNLGAIALLDKPIDNKKLERLILEQFIESRFLREKMLGIDSPKAIRVNRVFALDKDNIGLGGIAIRFDLDEELQELEALQPGSNVELSFRLEGTPQILTARGEMVWKRFAGPNQDAPSIGIKFLEVPEETQKTLNAFVRTHHIQSFIPAISTTARAQQ